MTPQLANQHFGATHFKAKADGVTPQMYFKQRSEKYNDGSVKTLWFYLTFANLWFVSGINNNQSEISDLKEITS